MAKDKNAYDKPSMDAAKKLRKDAKPLVADTDLRLGITGPAAQALDSQEASANAEAIVGIATVVLILLLLILIFRSVIIALMPIIVIGLVSQVAVGLVGVGQQGLRPQDRQLDPGDPDRGALRHRDRLHPVLPVPLPRTTARRRREPRPRSRSGGAGRRGDRLGRRRGDRLLHGAGAQLAGHLQVDRSRRSPSRCSSPCSPRSPWSRRSSRCSAPRSSGPRSRGRRSPRPPGSPPSAAPWAGTRRSTPRPPASCSRCSRCSRSASTPTSTSATPAPPPTSSRRSRSRRCRRACRPARPTRRRCCSPPTTGRRSTRRELTRSRRTWARPRASPRSRPAVPNPEGDTALFNVVLDQDPTSDASLANVKGPIRTTAHDAAPDGTTALVGGTTSVFVDFQKAMNRDYAVVFPVAAIVIMLILALLLRSLVAPIYLMISVGLGFGATLGAAVLRLPAHPGRGRADLPAADLHLPVRGGTRHRLQHLDDRAPARGGTRGRAAARRRRRGGQARRPDRRRGRRDPGRHLRVAHARRQRAAHRDGLLDLLRHLRRGVRDGDVLHALADRPARPRRVVARPRRRDAAGRGRGARAPGRPSTC